MTEPGFEPYLSLLKSILFHITLWFLEEESIELVLQSYMGFEQVEIKGRVLNVEGKVGKEI